MKNTKVVLCFCILLFLNQALANKWWPYQDQDYDYEPFINIRPRYPLRFHPDLPPKISPTSNSPVVEPTSSSPPAQSPQAPTPPKSSPQQSSGRPVDVAESVAQLFYVAIRDSLKLLEQVRNCSSGYGNGNPHSPTTGGPSLSPPFPPSTNPTISPAPSTTPVSSPVSSPASPSTTPVSSPVSSPASPSTTPVSSPVTSPAKSPTSSTSGTNPSPTPSIGSTTSPPRHHGIKCDCNCHGVMYPAVYSPDGESCSCSCD